MNIKTLHEIQVNKQSSERYYLQQNVQHCVLLFRLVLMN